MKILEPREIELQVRRPDKPTVIVKVRMYPPDGIRLEITSYESYPFISFGFDDQQMKMTNRTYKFETPYQGGQMVTFIGTVNHDPENLRHDLELSGCGEEEVYILHRAFIGTINMLKADEEQRRP